MLTTDCLHSMDDLRTIAHEWNDLWCRSSVTSAVYRAESLLSFLDFFTAGPDARLDVITVRDGDRLLAALPLVQTRHLAGFSIGGFPANDWSRPGALLVDLTVNVGPIFAELADRLQKSRFSLVRLDQIDLDAIEWTKLQSCFQEKKIPYETVLQYEVGTVDTQGDFETLFASCSKNLRSTLRRRRRRLEEQGPIRFVMLDHFSSNSGEEPIESLFQKMFELEQKTWKQAAGGTVLGNRGVFDYYVQLARLMDEGHQMRIALLEHKDRLIAYDLAVESKRVYHSYKVSYDPDFQRYSPGQLLHEEITRYACDSPEVDAIHYCGPMDGSISAWATDVHHFGHLTFSPDSFFNRTVWLGYCAAASVRRLWR